VRRTSIIVSVAVVIVVASAIGIVVAKASAQGGDYRGIGITPGNLASLTSEQTRVSGIPSQLENMPADLVPDAGTVHTLGGGVALAWEKPGRICWWERLTDGCLSKLSIPLDVVVGDPDVVGSGEPARAYGVATDEVASVTVTLADGRSVTTVVRDNFYDVDLPDGVPPWARLTVSAELNDGTTYTERV